MTCSSLSDLRDKDEVASALRTAVGSKQVFCGYSYDLYAAHRTSVNCIYVLYLTLTVYLASVELCCFSDGGDQTTR